MKNILALLFLLWSASLHGAIVQPTLPIHEGQRIVGFATEDPNLYYIVPGTWRLYDRKIFLERNPSTGGYALSFVLGPDYSQARHRMGEILNNNPHAILLPLPQNISEGFLDVPASVGTVSQQLIPDNIQYFQSLLYYRLELTPSQLDLLRDLAQSANFLLGRVTYSFPYQGGSYTNVNEIHLDLRESDLVEQAKGPEYPYLWIKTMLENYEMIMHGVMDGSYSLGGLVNIGLSDSTWSARVDTEASRFSADTKRIYIHSNGQPNLESHLEFHINELNSSVALDVKARLGMSLDAQDIALQIESLDITDVRVADGTVSTFYLRYLNTLVNRSDVRARLAEQLTVELQERILSQKLFID
ncbi:hypothetical protein [Oligoflexus tunisiensis]|uniref:hypothetical protein n=1 Tax=Oligoflexus tunisiensis TaxID=708132 RepID=UPI00114CDC5A|nr:hypothetical protein [Oligoflexus tunisiensis]